MSIKKNKISRILFIGLMTIALMMPNAIHATADQPDQSVNSDIVRSGKLGTMNGATFQELTKPYELNGDHLTTLTMQFSFHIEDNEVDGLPNRSVAQGDYFLIDLPDIVVIKDGNGTIMIDGEPFATYEQYGGHQLKVNFVDAKGLLADRNEFGINGKFEFSFDLDATKLSTDKKTEITFPIGDGSEIKLNVTPPTPKQTLPNDLKKRGAFVKNSNDTILWDVDLFPQKTGIFEGCLFEDTLHADTELVSMKHGEVDLMKDGTILDSSLQYDVTTGKIQYTIPNERNETAFSKIQIWVRIKDDALAKQNPVNVTNQATLTRHGSDPVSLTANADPIPISPQWLKKSGTLYEGNSIQWTINVNETKLNMKNAVVTDELQSNMFVDVSKDGFGKQKTNLMIDGNYVEIRNVSDPMGPIDTIDASIQVNPDQTSKLMITFPKNVTNTNSHKITFVTEVKRVDLASENLSNQASLDAEYVGRDGVSRNVSGGLDSAGVGVPNVFLSKTAQQLTAENKRDGTIDWEIQAASNLTQYGKSEIVESWEADQDLIFIKFDGRELTTDNSQDVYYTKDDVNRTAKITFKNKNALNDMQKLIVRTKIKPDIYGDNLKREFSNQASIDLFDEHDVNSIANSHTEAKKEVTNTVVEKKKVLYQGYDNKNGRNPRAAYEITINKNQMPLKTLTITDDFTKLVSSYQKHGESSTSVLNNFVWKPILSSIKVVKVSGDLDTFDASDFWTYDEASNTLTVDFKNHTVEDSYQLQYVLEADIAQNDALKVNGTIHMKGNQATLHGDPLHQGAVTANSQDEDLPILNTLLSKQGEQSQADKDNNQASYTIRMNQHRAKLPNTTVVDDLPEGLTLDPSTLALYENTIDASGNFKTGATPGDRVIDFEMVYEPIEGTNRYRLQVTLPENEKDYILKFAVDIDQSILNKDITNTAYYMGDDTDLSNSSDAQLHMQGGSSGSASKKVSASIKKLDAETDLPLQDAVFSLYWVNTSNQKESFVRAITTDVNGDGTAFGLTKGETYVLKETKAPVQYALDSTKKQFVAGDKMPHAFTFYNQRIKTVSWQPRLNKTMNKELDKVFDFTLREGDKVLMTGKNKFGNHLKTEPIVFNLVDGVVADDLFVFTNSHAFGAGETIVPIGPKRIFKVQETGNAMNGYTMDQSIKELHVQAFNKKGEPNLLLKITDENGNVLTDESGNYIEDKIPTFVNEYASKGDVTLNAKKIIHGGEMTEKLFRYTLTELVNETDVKPDGLSLTTQNDELGNIQFSKIKYTYQDVGRTHYYRITEDDEYNPGYTPDQNSYVVRVDVVDQGDGTIKATPILVGVGSLDHVVFESDYTAKDITLNLEGITTLTGKTLQTSQFFYQLDEVTQDGTFIKQFNDEIINQEDGKIKSPTLTYTQADINRTFYYQMREIAGHDKGYTYDSSTYQIIVTVKDNHNSTLSLDVTYIKDGVVTTDLLFQNRYQLQSEKPPVLNGTITGDDKQTLPLLVLLGLSFASMPFMIYFYRRERSITK